MIRKLLHAIFPDRYFPWGAFVHYRDRIRQAAVVQNGPFAGMSYVDEAFCSLLLPKLVGTYEMELNPIIRQVMDSQWDMILDVGTAEGYYLVGLARHLPTPRIVGYEMDASARELCRQLAEKNGLADRIELHEEATVDDLRATIGDARTFMLVDVEGAEDFLLDPSTNPALRTCTILVETHDCYVPGVSDRLRERFADTHEITRIDATLRDRSHVPDLNPLMSFYMQQYLYELVVERTVAQHWLYLVPKSAD